MTTRTRTMMKMALAEVDELQSQRHFAGEQRKKRQKVRQFRLMLGHVTQRANHAAKSSVAGGRQATGEAILAFCNVLTACVQKTEKNLI